jgi:hypothetical protein
MYKILLILFINKIISQVFDINSQECCANCLSRIDINGSYDSLSYPKCETIDIKNCCYEHNCHMSLITNNFILSNNINYNNNTPYIYQGEWIQLQWDNIEYITYIFINENQKKEIQPTNKSLIIESENKWFQICIESIGNLYFRGWDQNGCISSIEYNIKIIKNKENNICGNRPKIEIINNCNLNRANLIDGNCKCIDGYSNPPLCDKEAIWKILAIVMTSVSAFLSILCLISTYYIRKRNEMINEYIDFNN